MTRVFTRIDIFAILVLASNVLGLVIFLVTKECSSTIGGLS